MKAGKLNNLITLQSRDAGEDETGQPLRTFSDFAQVWAHILGATGMASIRQSSAMENVSTAIKSYSFRIRYREDLDESMRVSWQGRYFDILQIRMDFAGREWTDLVCELGGNDG